MPEYLAPGVYVEETSFRAKSIEGVGTSTTAFVGPTRTGPVSGGEEAPERPELLTSFGDFERIYGGLADLEFLGVSVPNYIAHAALAYFNEGGSRLYVARTVVMEEEEDDGHPDLETGVLAECGRSSHVCLRSISGRMRRSRTPPSPDASGCGNTPTTAGSAAYPPR